MPTESSPKGADRAAGRVGAASAVLCLIFFLSGASALLFETLWFRLAGITFGNSVWAGSIVLTSFMGGLALGNGLAARYGRRVRNAIIAYAKLEVLIAVTGVALVLIFPRLSGWLVPLFRPLLDQPWLINPLRLLFAFALMLVPTTAMGLTLPLLVKVLFAEDRHFGKILGRLYGWNTLGAVAGALAGEVALIGWFGVRGTGYVAAGLNLIAAVAAVALGPTFRATPASPEDTVKVRLASRSLRLLAGSFLAGGILLAFEVVWFRFLQLFVIGTSFSFAVMLATVLAGIGLGGLLASWWLRFRPGAHLRLVAVALASGVVAVLVYKSFAAPEAALGGHPSHAWAIARLSVWLMLPVSLLSGVLFTLFGEAAQKEIAQETRTAGLLTLANTTGSMVGAVLGGFVLLPTLGVERSFFFLGLAYVAVALLAAGPESWRRPNAFVNGPLAGLFLIALIVFPFGAMQRHLDGASRPYRERFKSTTVAVREGLTETIQYLRRDLYGEPLNYRLMTNAYSMSGTSLDSKRYMKFFVYWPVTIHPDPRRALLIGYGAGTTAKALTDTRALESIDVVDISRDILELSEIVYGADDPLGDPRVRSHVEDGRYFLQTTDHRFDLITAEPPPPVVGGAVNLYTEEYFQLIRGRLATGGIVTYWLPVDQMTLPASRSILAAFCRVFDDCSLWSGSHYDWVMIGSREATGPVSEEHFARQWHDPLVGPEMKALGFETPEQLGATFVGDARHIAAMVAGRPPLTDDQPKRLPLRPAGPDDRVQYRRWTDPPVTRRQFLESSLVSKLWPAALVSRTLPYFKYQRIANMQILPDDPNVLSALDAVLSDPALRTAALWLTGSSVDYETIIAKAVAAGREGDFDHYLGVEALADRQYALAANYFGRYPQSRPTLTEPLHVYTLCKLGRAVEARQLARRFVAETGRPLNYSCW